MALFFSGFVFFRNLLAPSESRAAFGMNISWRQLLSVVPVSFFGAITFCNVASATPPTHYILKNDFVYGPRVSGPTPDSVAQTVISNRNAVLVESIKYENLQACQLFIWPAAAPTFQCAFDICYYPPALPQPCNHVPALGGISIAPMCGNSGVAVIWNGTELTCPPESDCDGPAQ